MTDILILGGTGKTGRRVAQQLRDAGHAAHTAARGDAADVHFDWDDAGSRRAALTGAERVYLVPPALRLDHPPLVAAFLDEAVDAGVEHVTFLSADAAKDAPADTPLRRIELDLAARDALTHSVLRPTWFMQNLSEGFMEPGITHEGVIAMPTGDGAEAFVDADDIAAVAAATLTDPAAHAGAVHAIAGPEALTHAEVAAVLTEVLGRPVAFVDADPAAWRGGLLEAGLPAEYADLLAALTDTIRSGDGTRPTTTVADVTGRPPRDLRTYAEAAVAEGAWQAPVAS